MNTYTENLRSLVIMTLLQSGTDKQQLKFQLELARSKADHAAEVTRNAAEILEAMNQDCLYRSQIVDHALTNRVLASNVLNSASQLRDYNSMAVSNSAVAASNASIANNAISRLASNIGGILSIVTAADFDSEIYHLCQQVYELMKETALAAEKASQQALEASVLTSEIPGSSLAEAARNTDSGMKSFLDVAKAELQAIQVAVEDNAANWKAASTAEKQADGMSETVLAAYTGAAKAYENANNELNLDLRVKLKSGNAPVVLFDKYRAPFPEIHDPVQSYAVFVVKDGAKTIFSTAQAEDLLTKPKQHVSIPADRHHKHVEQMIDVAKLLDSDGDTILPGKPYVVFVLVIFNEAYKKTINNFEDLLSAFSEEFVLAGKSGLIKRELEENPAVMMEQLENEISDLKQEQEKSQLAVNVSTVKLEKSQLQLQAATEARQQAQAAEDAFLLLIEGSKDLEMLSSMCLSQATEADKAASTLASDMKLLTDKLIYAADVLNKAVNVIVRKKALNPLISDELISLVSSTGVDANSAVALTLTALQTAFGTQASIKETRQVSAEAHQQAVKLAEVLHERKTQSLKSLLHQAIERTSTRYELSLKTSQAAARQSSVAQSGLTRIQVELSSSQAGLEAMKALGLK